MSESSSDKLLGRRRFLTRAVLGGGAAIVGATALGALTPQAAQAAAQHTATLGAGQVDPNFAEGRIVSVNNGMLMVSGSDRTLHRIAVTNGTSLWKLRPTTLDQAKVGDGLYARGVRLPDGVLAADAVWLNIVNLETHIVAVGSKALQLDHRGSRIVGNVVLGTTAAVYNGTPAVSDLSLIQVGRHAQVIGAWRPDTNQVDIATIHTAA